MIPYGKQFIDDDDINEVIKVLKSDYLTTGPKIGEFEEAFAKYVGVRFATAVSNGTAALHVACLAAGLKKDDRLMTTPMTFAASSNCGLYCNAIPVFADITKNGLIDPKKVKEKINPACKIIIPVHYAGFPCDLESIKEIAQKNGSFVIEDACHAMGARYKDSKIGDCRYSDMAIFSFHPVKHITTGEGGMITTNSKELDEKLKIFRTHGITRESHLLTHDEGPWYYEMQYLGYNYRMTDIQAALGISQLKKIEKFVARRQVIAKKYDKAFAGSSDLDILENSKDCISTYHLYPILLKKQLKSRKRLIFEAMKKNGIGVQVHYIPVYYHPYYKKLGYQKGSCPVAEDFYERELSIPMFYALTDEQIDFVIENVKKSVRQG